MPCQNSPGPFEAHFQSPTGPALRWLTASAGKAVPGIAGHLGSTSPEFVQSSCCSLHTCSALLTFPLSLKLLRGSRLETTPTTALCAERVLRTVREDYGPWVSIIGLQVKFELLEFPTG